MGIYNLTQIQKIIVDNPNKDIVKAGRLLKNKLRMHVYGDGLDDEIKRDDYFENADIYRARKQYATSNKDLFARLLHEESMVFTARGGGATFGMPQSDEKKMFSLLSDVIYGLNLRKWLTTFALPAYRTDPTSIIFMEVEQTFMVTTDTVYPEPKCYPTYKSISCIHDYLPNGRNLEYVCFHLSNEEAAAFGVKMPQSLSNSVPTNEHVHSNTQYKYYRFVDDAQDVILILENNIVSVVTGMEQQNPIANQWGKVPAFIVSDLMRYDIPQAFVSPLDNITELASTYLYDRSIRDLQKKYHGFAKAVEPLMQCPRCMGEGVSKGLTCPECTVPGADKGTGYKLRTKISDVARFPLTMWDKDNAASGFDWRSAFGYVTPDIESWNKQDSSLTDLESIQYFTYWGVNNTIKTSGVRSEKDSPEATATASLLNLQPKYARLNMTADWGESCENKIADLIGQFWFDDKWNKSSISYGRNYILETPDDILEIYQNMLTLGAPDNVLDDQAEKYIRSIHQNNPMELAKQLKLFHINPFPHSKASEIELSPIIPAEDKLAKRYFGEWIDTLNDIQILSKKPDVLLEMLKEYIAPKVVAYNTQQAKEAALAKPATSAN